MAKLFPLVWVSCYIIYPTWFLPTSASNRLLVLAALLSFFALHYILLKRWFGRLALPTIREWARKELLSPVQETLVVPLLIGLAVALHLYPMMFPVGVGAGDESYHSWYVLGMIDRISRNTNEYLGVSVLSLLRIFIFVALVSWAAAIYAGKGVLGLKRFLPSGRYLLGIAVVLILVALWSITITARYDNAMHVYPPMPKIFTLLSYAIFGVNEFALRFPSLLFSCLAGVFLYKTIRVYHSLEAAALGLTFWLFLPDVFYHSHLAYLELGSIFFMCASGYYFIRFVQEKRPEDFLLAMFFMGSGYLYKQFTLLLLPLYLVTLVYYKFIRRESLDLVLYSKMLWVGLATALPWIIFDEWAGRNPYQFSPQNFLSVEIASRIFRDLPSQATLLMFILFLGGLFWGIKTPHRHPLIFFSIVQFVINYVTLTSDREIAVGFPRLTQILFPYVVIVSAVFFAALSARIKPLLLKHLVYGAIVLFFISQSPITPDGALIKHGLEYYVPLDELFKYVKKNIPPHQRLTVLPTTSPLGFYKYKHNAEIEIVNRWDADVSRRFDPDEFIQSMKDEKIDYLVVIVPRGLSFFKPPNWASPGWIPPLEDSAGPVLASFLNEITSTNYKASLSLQQQFPNKEGLVALFRVND